jgi:hypothetical protein
VTRDRWFESTSLQERVCELPVPGDPLHRDRSHCASCRRRRGDADYRDPLGVARAISRARSHAKDYAVPEHIPGELKAALDKVDAKYELKVFQGTQHGFCFPERAVYDTLAAEETSSKIIAMWDRRLK